MLTEDDDFAFRLCSSGVIDHANHVAARVHSNGVADMENGVPVVLLDFSSGKRKGKGT